MGSSHIVFVLPVSSQPRFYKRIEAAKRAGKEVTILSFERDYYAGRIQEGDYISLGYVQHRHYIARLNQTFRASRTIRRVARDADTIYAFGYDSALASWLALRGTHRNTKLVYEVGDIREILTHQGWLPALLRTYERMLLSQVDLLIITSKAYMTGYYEGVLGLTGLNYLVIENKIDPSLIPHFTQTLPKPVDDRIIRIGYFGLLRCQISWLTLKRVAMEGGGRFQVYLRGLFMGLGDVLHEVAHLPNMRFEGAYLSPDDLPDIYGQVDVSWIAHFHATNNTRWSRVNRFYEAAYFRKPMFAQVNTEDAKDVSRFDLGRLVDLTNIDASVQRVLETDWEQINQWRNNLEHLPEEIYTLTDEHQQLFARIQAL